MFQLRIYCLGPGDFPEKQLQVTTHGILTWNLARLYHQTRGRRGVVSSTFWHNVDRWWVQHHDCHYRNLPAKKNLEWRATMATLTSWGGKSHGFKKKYEKMGLGQVVNPKNQIVSCVPLFLIVENSQPPVGWTAWTGRLFLPDSKVPGLST